MNGIAYCLVQLFKKLDNCNAVTGLSAVFPQKKEFYLEIIKGNIDILETMNIQDNLYQELVDAYNYLKGDIGGGIEEVAEQVAPTEEE